MHASLLQTGRQYFHQDACLVGGARHACGHAAGARLGHQEQVRWGEHHHHQKMCCEV